MLYKEQDLCYLKVAAVQQQNVSQFCSQESCAFPLQKGSLTRWNRVRAETLSTRTMQGSVLFLHWSSSSKDLEPPLLSVLMHILYPDGVDWGYSLNN